MKAIVYHEYGPVENLKLEEVDIPSPAPDEVQIKLHAASVNSWDHDLLRGTPFIVRIDGGFLKPKLNILGCDIAGTVEQIGENVKKFKPGDEVYGDISGCGWGGYAEYVCAREDCVRPKPEGMSFEDAAAIPQGAVLALQGLLDKRKAREGDKVLINGAGGCAGPFGIQIAKFLGAEVTAVDSSEKLDLLKSLGADHVIDFRKEDFTKTGQTYDLILENITQRFITSYKRALNPGGLCILTGGVLKFVFLNGLLGLLPGSRKVRILPHIPNKHLTYFEKLYAEKKVKTVIDGPYTLEEVPEAFKKIGEGRVMGKAVIKII